MKQDKLESFIRENSKGFDVFEPDDKMWDRIHKPNSKVVKLSWKTIVIRIAAVIVIFIGSYFVHDWVQGKKSNKILVLQPGTNGERMEGMENVKVLMEAEVYYASQINFAKNEIVKLSVDDPGLMKGIDYDFVELDQVFKELKEDLKDDSDNEEVIEAMIENYRIKLDILEETLRQLRKSRKVEKTKDEYHEI